MIRCAKSELSILDPQIFQTTMEKGCWVDYPAQIIADNGTGQVEFYVPASMSDYMDLNDTMLYLKVKIVQTDDGNIPSNAEIAFTNMPISSLFADVQLSLNNNQIEGGNRTYPYCAYIATLLQNGHGAKKEQLFAGGFIKDVAGQFKELVGRSARLQLKSERLFTVTYLLQQQNDRMCKVRARYF